MERRTVLKGALGATALAFGPGFWRDALAAPAQPGEGPYGELQAADANGLRLPAGFTSRVVARSGAPVGASAYVWHTFPDGGACFPTDGGGWIYTSNSEVPAPGGGAGAIEFGPDGAIVDARRILDGTGGNCAGGPTPWGTWLSCEETDTGQVWECDPEGRTPGIARPAMGRFSHEAAAVDPNLGFVYLTEDEGDSLFYRFTPTVKDDLSAGTLEAARWDEASGNVTWLPIPDPAATSTPTRQQAPGATTFRRGEGLWFDSGTAYFTTTSDDRVWAYDGATSRLEVIYDAAASPELALHDPDNITAHPTSGDLFVAEDADNLEIVLVTAPGPARVSAPFLRIEGQPASEVAGPAFSPDGRRLYFSSQRGGPAGQQGPGITYEVTGPFRGSGPGTEVPEVASAALLGIAAAAVAGTAALRGRSAPDGRTTRASEAKANNAHV